MYIPRRTLRRIEQVQRQYEDELFSKANVVAVAIGMKQVGGEETDTLAIQVYVGEKIEFSALAAEDVIASELDGIPTDVVEMGEPVLLANTERMRPAIGGISIGHARTGSTGTLGALLASEADGRLYMLSNNHVLASINAGMFGDAVIQAGSVDGGMDPADRVGTLFRYPFIDRAANSNNLIDCAIAQPTAANLVRPVILDGWSNPYPIPGWFGSENQDGDVALFDISANGRPDLVVLHIDNPSGENRGYYRIGWNVDRAGNVTGGWTNPIAIPGWWGHENQGAGITVADVNGNGQPDLIVFHIDNPGGENRGYYRIGWNVDRAGNVTGGWSNPIPIPGWWGHENQGGGIAAADINGDGRLELIVFHIDNPGGENRGYYRVGWALDASGTAAGGWGGPVAIPGWFGADNQGGGIALAAVSGDFQLDMIVYHIDNPSGDNIAYYRIGRDLQRNGLFASWSEVRQVSGWIGHESQGGGIAAGDIDGDGDPELFSLHIDNPGGENRGYYRVSFNIDRSFDFAHGLRGSRSARLGDRIWKSGRTTELTNGTITGINATVTIGDGAGGTLGRFVDQLIIAPAISRPGDSGSVIVDSEDRVVGLLFAGSSAQTIANRIEHVLDGLRWSSINAVPGWFGHENQAGDVALADLNRSGQPDMVVFHIDNPGGENRGYFRIGRNVDGNGDVRGGWTNPIAIPGWFGAENQGGGIALGDISGNGQPDLVVMHIDNPGGENRGYYRIGWNLDANGNTGGWTNPVAIPGWFGAENQGGSIALADLNSSGRPDLIVFHIDNPGGENRGYYRIGWNLDTAGNVTGGWTNPIAIPGWFGTENQGGGIAAGDVNGDGRPELVVFHLDNPSGENRGYYRIGYMGSSGAFTWGPTFSVRGWFGTENQGGGVAITNLNGGARADLVVFHIDNPGGENRGYYRVAWDLNSRGAPSSWSIA
jgi:hypothetical protein